MSTCESLTIGRAPRFRNRGGRAESNQMALARLHSAPALNRAESYAAEGGGSFAATTQHALSAALLADSHRPPRPPCRPLQLWRIMRNRCARLRSCIRR